MRQNLYKGYVIEMKTGGRSGYIIKKDDRIVCSQPSEEFARKWIDRQEAVR